MVILLSHGADPVDTSIGSSAMIAGSQMRFSGVLITMGASFASVGSMHTEPGGGLPSPPRHGRPRSPPGESGQG